MRIVSWNVNGIRACAKKGLQQTLSQLQPDILCLQETKAHREQVEPEVQSLGYRFSSWSSAEKKGYSGVATFCTKEPLEVRKALSPQREEREGRIVWTRHSEFDLYNIYFPNGGSGPERHDFKQIFLRELSAHLKGELAQGRHIILVGDYNVAHQEVDVHDPVRLSHESGFLPEEREWFSQFLCLGFIDTFRHLHPKAKDRYSWWSYRELARTNNRGWRIDYVCISKSLLPHLRQAHIWDQVEGSDHCPVGIDILF